MIALDSFSTEELRHRFLVEHLFNPGGLVTVATDLDRLTIGGAMPLAALTHTPAPNHETGILNLGDPADVLLDDERHTLDPLDCVYAGSGVREITFLPAAGGHPLFYFASCPAHRAMPSGKLALADAESAPIGDTGHASKRTIRKFICPGKLESCQLVMGFTELECGSIWNTMPAHTHVRRSEIYLYFDLGDGMVIHLMGKPEATRHLIVRNHQAVLSPSWSMHSGAGTNSYRFVWVMAGENRDFADIDPIPMGALR
jgi:4-deoxy-L-threo-5-hexosulose-uronate ketol-isomerase